MDASDTIVLSALFPPPAVDSCEHTGVLVHAAEVRARPLDGEGHMVPVVCCDIELENKYRTPMRVEKLFPIGHHEQAKAEAHRLKKGVRITVQAPLFDFRLVAPNASHIFIHPAAPAAHQPLETSEPCQASLL